MGDAYQYLYAFAGANCPWTSPGPGVDPRFPVEPLHHGQLAALISRVGPDRFDVARLQGKSADDIKWLSRIAVRHNQIICAAARWGPVVPLRLGTLLRCRRSLQARMAAWEGTVTDFLRGLGDRQEWAAKILLLDRRADLAARAARGGRDPIDPPWGVDGAPRPKAPPGHPVPPPPHHAALKRSGTQYLTQKRSEQQQRRAFRCHLQQQLLAVETALIEGADRWCRVRPLPAGLTGRQQEVAWNAAFLVPRAASESWLAAAERLRRTVAGRGLLLEVTGPWPPYHFCPTLAP